MCWCNRQLLRAFWLSLLWAKSLLLTRTHTAPVWIRGKFWRSLELKVLKSVKQWSNWYRKVFGGCGIIPVCFLKCLLKSSHFIQISGYRLQQPLVVLALVCSSHALGMVNGAAGLSNSGYWKCKTCDLDLSYNKRADSVSLGLPECRRRLSQLIASYLFEHSDFTVIDV